MEIGVFTFADLRPDPFTGRSLSPAERVRDIVELAELADDAGVDVFGVGEHHRTDFAVTSPEVVLGAIAARTFHIRLTSAVTVLSSADPVKVFEQFTAVDLLSGGRAEVMAGRGAFIESFPLYGNAVTDYEALFEEKLALLLTLTEQETVSWQGQFRAPLVEQPIYPRPVQERLPVWIGVGGTPASAIRAAHLGLPMTIGIVGGNPANFAPLAGLYRRSFRPRTPGELPRLGITSHAFVAQTSQAAVDIYFPIYARMLAGRGHGELSREQFDRMRSLDGHLFVGSPAEVAEKILYQHEIFGHDRFLAQIPNGPVDHRDAMRALELLGSEVLPAVHAGLADPGHHHLTTRMGASELPVLSAR